MDTFFKTRRAVLVCVANEVNETMDLGSDLGKHYREENLPLLFLLRPEVNFQVFSNQFISNPYNERLFKSLVRGLYFIVFIIRINFEMVWKRLMHKCFAQKQAPALS